MTVLANDSPYGVVKWKFTTMTVEEPEGSDAEATLYVVREQGLAGDLQVTFRYISFIIPARKITPGLQCNHSRAALS